MRAWIWPLLLLAIVLGARWRVRDEGAHAFDALGVALLALVVVVLLRPRRS